MLLRTQLYVSSICLIGPHFAIERPMFEGWGEFYLLAGSAAAVLIGLIFVVVTLMQDRPRSYVLNGSKLYMGPVALHVSFVLVLSTAALVPGISPPSYATVSGAVAIWGLVRSVSGILGIRALAGADQPHWTDVWFYGVLPSVLFVVLAGVSLAVWMERPWAAQGIAAIVTAALLLTIRNEWDLVTWLAPRADSPRDSE